MNTVKKGLKIMRVWKHEVKNEFMKVIDEELGEFIKKAKEQNK